jgi:glycine/D-amino acid oxidase-like deaminating enzyme
MLVYQKNDSLKDGIETLNFLKQYGVSGEILDSVGIRERDPNLRPCVVGRIYYPDYEHVLPERYVKGMAQIAEDRGAILKTETEVIGFETARKRIAATQRAVNLYLSGIDELELIQIWSGFRPNTPDTLPIIERNKAYADLIQATGHDMFGMTHSLITGKLVSEIIAGETPSVDLNPFRLSRFR